jgi:hypothetical protein
MVCEEDSRERASESMMDPYPLALLHSAALLRGSLVLKLVVGVHSG